MSTIYRSETVTVIHDPRGFVEWTVREKSMPTMEELETVGRQLAERGLAPARVLVARINRYATPEDFNVVEIGRENVAIERLAYFAPGPGDRVFSKLMSLTALRNIPTQIFSDREAAIAWLLADD
jgi:hypothetical protein